MKCYRPDTLKVVDDKELLTLVQAVVSEFYRVECSLVDETPYHETLCQVKALQVELQRVELHIAKQIARQGGNVISS